MEAAPTASAAAHTASDDLAEVYRLRCEDQPMPDPGVCPQLKRAKTAAEDVAKVSDDVNALVTNQKGDLAKLRAQLTDLEKQADALAKRAPNLDTDLESAVKRINALNTGAHKVAKGAGELHTGLGTAKTRAPGTWTRASRSSRRAPRPWTAGCIRLGDGSATLAQGLNDGVGKIPDYDKKDRDARTGVMADPVQLASSSLHAAPNYGTGFAPYFIPLSLWVGAMVAYMLIQPLNRRALAAGAPAWRIAFAGWLPVAAHRACSRSPP